MPAHAEQNSASVMFLEHICAKFFKILASLRVYIENQQVSNLKNTMKFMLFMTLISGF
jgi:hypothetical protein